MKTIRFDIICYCLSALFVVFFAVQLTHDYNIYTMTVNSAPFYVWIIANALYFLLPSALFLISGIAIGIKRKKNKEDA